MNKYILLAAASISLIACDSEDNYIDEPVEAHFSATIDNTSASRAANTDWADGDSIGVFMVDRYSNIKYSFQGNNDFSGNPIYFKNKQDPEDFFAYYPFTGTEGESPATVNVSTRIDFQTETRQPEIDFLYASVEGVTGANPNITFSFDHKMSKVSLLFKNGNSGTKVSKITSLEIAGLIMDGTFNPLTGVCQGAGAAETITKELPEGTITETTPVSFIFLPQQVEKVTLKIRDSEEQTYSCDLDFRTAEIVAGNNYQFTITVKKTTLSVKSTIVNWNEVELDGEAISDDSDE